jgi:hypothetical protein
VRHPTTNTDPLVVDIDDALRAYLAFIGPHQRCISNIRKVSMLRMSPADSDRMRTALRAFTAHMRDLTPGASE